MEHQLQIFPKEEEIDYEALPADASVYMHLAAGAFAGIMEHTVMFPIDSLKTRMQMAGSGKAAQAKGVVSHLSRISASEGARALWRGVSSVVLGAGPAHAVYFSVFEATKTLLVNRMTDQNSTRMVTDENHPLIASCAGIAATTASDALMTPFDVLKQRMQAGNPTGSSLWRTALGIYRREGLAAFYISYPTTLLTNIPFAALNFGFYEYSSKILNPSNSYNPYVHCVAGGIAGGIAAALTNPFDCIKTALQTRGITTNESMKNINGFASAVRVLHSTGGMRAFWSGLRPRIIFNVPSTAISWTAYEMAKEVLLRD